MMQPDTTAAQIVFPTMLTELHQQLMVRYSRLPRAITRAEWVQALEAFDMLHTGRITQGRSSRTFQRFYQDAIDTVHATLFLEELLKTSNVETDGSSLITSYWQKIASELNAQGITAESMEGCVLIAYCLYWWQSFGKGYIREIAIFRDLEQSGILYEAHDLRDPIQRRSVYDLTVLNQRGDIKTSTYFLHSARMFPLRCAFYIIRLFDTKNNRWLDIVMLKRDAWDKLNGEPIASDWSTVSSVLPAAAQVEIRGESLVVVLYTEWKERVLSRQSDIGDEIE